MRVIYKYGTGHEVPQSAMYLTTVVEETDIGRFVWHYFVVEVKEQTQ